MNLSLAYKINLIQLVIAFITATFNNVYAQNSTLVNVLKIPNGGYIIKAPVSYQKAAPTANNIVDWSKEAIIDGSTEKGWSIRQGENFPHEFIFEIPSLAIINRFSFNTECEKEFPGIAAKDVSISISTESAYDGYIEVGKYILSDDLANQNFNIKEQQARWIKLIIHSNHGYEGLTELMEFEAWGYLTPALAKPVNLTGDWTSTWGIVSIRQIGSSIHGCYQYRNGKILNAGIDEGIFSFDWAENGPNGNGKAMLKLNEEGNRLNGIWCFKNNFKTYGVWTFQKKSDKPSLCYTDSINTKEQEQISDQIKSDLHNQGKVVMYGINFESNSATLKVESSEKLNQILHVLQEDKLLKLRIEGHTDNSGNQEQNQVLSTQRANSVKNYFINNGITKERLTTTGKGDSTPISTNDNELGKAANRRVEFWLVK